MRPRRPPVRLAVAAALALGAATASAEVAVSDAWVRGTVAGQKATGAYMRMKSSTDATLVSAASPVAGVVEIHEMKIEGSMMRMSAIGKLTLPAGKTVELKPGGYHVMLMELKRPLSEGEAVAVTLTFEDKSGRKQTLEVKAPVKALAATPEPAHKH